MGVDQVGMSYVYDLLWWLFIFWGFGFIGYCAGRARNEADCSECKKRGQDS